MFPSGTTTKSSDCSDRMRGLGYFQAEGIQAHFYFLSKDFSNHLAISSLLEKGRREQRGLISSPLAELVPLALTEQVLAWTSCSVIRVPDSDGSEAFNVHSCSQKSLLRYHLSKVLITMQ